MTKDLTEETLVEGLKILLSDKANFIDLSKPTSVPFGSAPIKREGGSYVPFPSKEHFTCELCKGSFTRTSFHDHAGETDEETVSLCDSCYTLFLEEAEKQGYKINDIGGLEEQ